MKITPIQTPDETDDIDLLGLLGTLWRGRWIILLCVFVLVMIGGYYSYRIATPMYPAQATVALNLQQQQIVTDIESVIAAGGSDTTAINTEVEVFRSRGLLGRLVDRLDLTGDPEFNAALRDPSLRTRLMRRLGLAPPSREDADGLARNRAIDALQSRLEVTNIRQSLAFTLSILTTDPDKSALIINTFAELYVEDQIVTKLEAAAQATEFLSRRTSELQQSLETLEQDLARATEQSNVVSQEVLQAQNLQLRDLRERIVDQTRRNTTAQSLLDRLNAATDLPHLIAVAEASDDIVLERIAMQYRTDRLETFEARAALDAAIASLADDGLREATQLGALEASAETLTAQVQAQSEDLIALQQLAREAEAARLLYQSFLTRLQETNVQQGLEAADSRILSEAVPRPAATPRHNINLPLSGLLGLTLGAGIVLLRETLFTGFRSPDDLRRQTDSTVLASIPLFGTGVRHDIVRHLRENPNSIASEAVRNLRTSILMSDMDNPPQVILVTSSVPAEGKTTIAVALARNLAAMEGKRALLLEADIRRKTLRAYVDADADATTSLGDLLMGKTAANDAVLWNAELGVDVLAGSDVPMNAADLFASNRFADMMAALRARYDFIVIDTPPVLAVPDARVLARHADAIIYAVHWSRTTRMQVHQGLEMLNSIGITVAGTVLSQVDTRKMKSYGYGGQYGYDGYASKYYSEG